MVEIKHENLNVFSKSFLGILKNLYNRKQTPLLKYLTTSSANKFSDKLQISVFPVSKGVNLYRILSNCFKTLNDANKVLKTAMEISKEIGLERPPIIIAQ